MTTPRIDTHSTRIDLIDTTAGRILCVADVRGALSSLNTLAAQHQAVAIIHSGDFGFYEPSSLASISDRTLKHLIQYSSLITPQFRSQLLSSSTSPAEIRRLLTNPPPSSSTSTSTTQPFVLSEFPKLLSGELKFNVPVYTVWGACEDVSILEKIRLSPIGPPVSIPQDPKHLPPQPPTTESTSTPSSSLDNEQQRQSNYSIPNLTVLDEATTRVLIIGGVRLRLFGLGGAVVGHKLFDNGQGQATIAGGQGTMWTTMLQIGELVDTAQKVYDPTETRLLITHASPGREGLISQLALVLKVDLTISAGLHFRYGSSYNEFSVQHDPEAYRLKLDASRKAFGEVWEAVKNQVEGVVDEQQKLLLKNALAVANRVPNDAPVQGMSPVAEETAWKNCWNWNLPDAAFGSLVLDVRDGRIGCEMKSQGFNFAYRANSKPPLPPPTASNVPPPSSSSAPTPPAPSSAPSTVQPVQSTQPPSTVSQAQAAPPYQQRPPHFTGQHHGVGRGGIQHQRAPSGPRGGGRGGASFAPRNVASSSAVSAGGGRAAPILPTSAAVDGQQGSNTPVTSSTTTTKVESESTPSMTTTTNATNVVSSTAPATSNNVSTQPQPPTGPRGGNRPPSQQSQRNNNNNNNTSSTTPVPQPTTSVETVTSSESKKNGNSTNQPEGDKSSAVNNEKPSNVVESNGASTPAPGVVEGAGTSSTGGSGRGRGRGRGGRGGHQNHQQQGSGSQSGSNSSVPPLTPSSTTTTTTGGAAPTTGGGGSGSGRGARGRSNGDWTRGKGRGGGGAGGRQGSGEAGSTPTTGAAGGGETST